MSSSAPLPSEIGGIAVPQDDVSGKTWHWAQRALPDYLLGHSVRAYCWGAAIAAGEGWAFDAQILWTASLMHDYALTRIPQNTMCFEVEGAEIARRFLERSGMDPEAADRAMRKHVRFRMDELLVRLEPYFSLNGARLASALNGNGETKRSPAPRPARSRR